MIHRFYLTQINDMERLKYPILEKIIENQQKKLADSLWSNAEDKIKYGFELSPNVGLINEAQKAELLEINSAVFGDGGYLEGALGLYNALSVSEKLKATGIGGMIWKAMNFGINKHEKPIQGLINRLPLFARCDLMTTEKVNSTGSIYQIAEVEGDKTHGMGYYDGFILPNCKEITGQISGKTFTEAVKREVGRETVFLLIGNSERFYLAEMEKLLWPVANKADLDLVVVTENTLKLNKNSVNPLIYGEKEGKFLVNLPVLEPDGPLVKKDCSDKNLYDMCVWGEVECLIPPNRFLSNKALLGIVSNGLENPESEIWVKEYFDQNKLNLLREYIPRTILVNKYNLKTVKDLLENEGDNWVVKKTVSSGSKGVSLDKEDHGKRQAMLKDMDAAPLGYIIQYKISQRTKHFWHTEQDLSGIVNSALYTRTELYGQSQGILAVGMTARPETAVHVQTDAIQIPVRFGS